MNERQLRAFVDAMLSAQSRDVEALIFGLMKIYACPPACARCGARLVAVEEHLLVTCGPCLILWAARELS